MRGAVYFIYLKRVQRSHSIQSSVRHIAVMALDVLYNNFFQRKIAVRNIYPCSHPRTYKTYRIYKAQVSVYFCVSLLCKYFKSGPRSLAISFSSLWCEPLARSVRFLCSFILTISLCYRTMSIFFIYRNLQTIAPRMEKFSLICHW